MKVLFKFYLFTILISACSPNRMRIDEPRIDLGCSLTQVTEIDFEVADRTLKLLPFSAIDESLDFICELSILEFNEGYEGTKLKRVMVYSDSVKVWKVKSKDISQETIAIEKTPELTALLDSSLDGHFLNKCNGNSTHRFYDYLFFRTKENRVFELLSWNVEIANIESSEVIDVELIKPYVQYLRQFK